MCRRSLVAALLVASLSMSVHAETLREAAARAGAAAGAQVTAQNEGRIPPGYLWSGIALLGGGGAYLAWAATMSSEDYTCLAGTCVENSTVRTGRFILGGALAGTGAFLLMKGISKKNQSAPNVTFVPGGVALEKKVSF